MIPAEATATLGIRLVKGNDPERMQDLVEAHIRRLRRLGRNAFMEYQLPEAVTLLRQGAGRLIRDERDRGVLMILDDRLLGKPYGRTVLASLPPFARTRDEGVARAFFAPAGLAGKEPPARLSASAT